jgi:hypothetical protein
MHLNISETPFTYGIYTESRGLTSLFGRLLELITKITFEAANFIIQVLAVLLYGGSSFMKTGRGLEFKLRYQQVWVGFL